MKKMTKKSLCYMILISLMVLITSPIFAIKAKAHPPGSMTLSYSSETLEVLIIHGVQNPNVHYIDLVIISVNGSEVQRTNHTSQSSAASASYAFSITANYGARIEVYARCVVSGSSTGCMVVGGGSCGQSGGLGIPGYFELWLILGFSIIISITITYKKIRH